MPDDTPVAWRGVAYGTPVISRDGVRAGTVAEMLGSDAEDVFHGIRVALAAARRDVVLLADDVSGLTGGAVTTDLSAVEMAALPAYDAAATYHLASVGWLRHHLGWRRDSGADEEPG